jgi:hypothetical protein
MPSTKKGAASGAKKSAASGAKKGAAPGAKKAGSEKAQLLEKLARELGVGPEEVEVRALRELAGSLGVSSGKKAPGAVGAGAGAGKKPPDPRASTDAPQEAGHYLPQRLYLAMDGRGLEGRGMPVEVIDLPCVIGSEKRCSVWINSPQIETRHLQITHTGEGWVLEDLGSEHGTFFGDKRIQRHVIKSGDEFRLAGYLRLRTDLV